MRAAFRGALVVGLLTAISCHLPTERGAEPLPPEDPTYNTMVQVRFLGVGGFLIRRGEDVVLTAPLYSNPELTKLDGVILPDPERIRAFNRHVSEVDAVLVGHAHDDHLMEVPLALERSPGATIHGNESVAYILNGYTGPDSVPCLTFLIDFLDETGTKPIFRIYYQDAPTPPTIGEVALDLLAEKPVDVAILCAGNFLDVDDPGHIVRNTRAPAGRPKSGRY